MNLEELKLYIMTQFVLEYRTSLDTLSKLFNIEQNELYNTLISNKDSVVKKALIYVLDYETKQDGIIDQKIAKRKANMFLFQLHSAKNEKEKLDLIKQLHNKSEISHIVAKRGDLTNEEIDTVIKYRYKYALNRQEIIEKFRISERIQRTRESKMDEETQKKLHSLNTYHQYLIQKRM